MINLDKYKKYAPSIVRVGVALVFLWFGLNQIFDTSSFLGWLPSWAYLIPISSSVLVIISGVIETVFGLLLLLGLYTRFSALILLLQLIVIIVGLGYNDIMIRDVGLSFATLSILIHGKDEWCFGNK
jgi:uncharacterized membrane protein YphA (DoxX/SURF4 family)